MLPRYVADTYAFIVNRTRGFKDLHDRIIVATSRIFDAVLISRDKTISEMHNKVLW